MVRVLVVGCSYGGLKTLLTLRRVLPGAEIVGIDRSPYHTNITTLPSFLAGAREHTDLLLPLDKFLSKRKITFRQEEVVGLEPKYKRIFTSKRRTTYDYLVLSFGAEPVPPNIKQPHVFSPYSLPVSKELKSYLEKQIVLGNKINAVIVGAGLAGIEWACALKSYLADKGTVTLIESKPAILPYYSEKIRNYVRNHLSKIGVTIKSRSIVKSISATKVNFSKGRISANVVLWLGGVRNKHLITKLGLQTSEKGILVNDTLQTISFPSIFAVGDTVAFASSTQPVKRATSALIQGELVAKNILRHINARSLKHYEVNEMPLGIYLGPGQGLIHYKGFMYTGWLAWWSKQWREMHYL